MLPAILALLPALQGQLSAEETARRNYAERRTPVVEVVEAAAPAVVYIQTDSFNDVPDFFGRLWRQRVSGAGSGVVILKEGFIVTNFHVVRGANSINVSFDEQYDRKSYPAQLVSYVEKEDLALLRIQGDRDFPTIPLGTSSDLMPGETVIAIGNPYGQTHTVSVGIISGLHRNVEIANPRLSFSDLIQTDASINFGNSGGPLLNIHGELIGISSAMNVQAENIGFAIPVDRVREVLEDQLLDPGTASSFLGFEVGEDDGLVVERVLQGGPADLAGLQSGDRILAIAGQSVANQEQYRLQRLCLAPENEVDLAVQRGGRRVDLKTRPWDKADGILYEGLGMTVEGLWIGRSPYVQVGRVGTGGAADALGLRPGDLIDTVRTQVGNRTLTRQVTNRNWLANLTAHLAPGAEIDIEVFRDLDQDGQYERDELHRGKLVRR